MPIKKYTTEQIIGLLRDAEILLAEGNTVAMASKKLGISEQSHYRWRKEYGGMQVVDPNAVRIHDRFCNPVVCDVIARLAPRLPFRNGSCSAPDQCGSGLL
jgi:hypothetical protein